MVDDSGSNWIFTVKCRWALFGSPRRHQAFSHASGKRLFIKGPGRGTLDQ